MTCKDRGCLRLFSPWSQTWAAQRLLLHSQKEEAVAADPCEEPAHVAYCFKQWLAQYLLCEAQQTFIPGGKFCQHRWLSNLETIELSWETKQQPPDDGGSNFSQTYLHKFGEAGEWTRITHVRGQVLLYLQDHILDGDLTRGVVGQRRTWEGRPPRKGRVLSSDFWVGFVMIFLKENCGYTVVFKH